MTPESQRIAIAEACGWKHIARFDMTFVGGRTTINGHLKDEDDLTPIPDYLNDLNAMHEAEKVLIAKSLWIQYNEELKDAISDDVHCPTIAHATAAQRAEAFLRTLNLWTE